MPDIKTLTRKERQLNRKAEREKDIADRRHDAEIQARIKRQMNVYYYKVDNCWYKTEKKIQQFAKWFEDYFKTKSATLTHCNLRKDFGDNPPVAFDVDRVGY